MIVNSNGPYACNFEYTFDNANYRLVQRNKTPPTTTTKWFKYDEIDVQPDVWRLKTHLQQN